MSTGDVYKGGWMYGKKEGRGTYLFANSDVYEGNKQIDNIGYFKEGAREGRGKYKWNDNSYYDGEWKGDKMHGRGVYCSAEGVATEGYF